MEQNGPKFHLRLNLFDTLVLALAVLAAAFLLWRAVRPAAGDNTDPAASATVRYTVCFQRWAEGSEAVIQVGDSLADNIKNYEIGRVVSVQAVPARTLVADQEGRAFVRAELEGYEDVLVTVESACTVTGEAVTIGGGYEIRVGNMGYYRGEGYMGSGPVMALEIEEAAK